MPPTCAFELKPRHVTAAAVQAAASPAHGGSPQQGFSTTNCRLLQLLPCLIR